MEGGSKVMKPLNQITYAQVLAFLKTVDKRTWIIIVASIAGCLLALMFLVIPAWVERPLLRRDIASMEEQIRQVHALNQKRAGWEENQKLFGDLIEDAQKRIFTETDMGLLLGLASKFAGESRVDVLASKPLAEKTTYPAPYDMKYQPSGYEFTMQGGYHDLGTLVSRIESHDKLLKVQSIEIKTDDKNPGRHIADLKLWAIMKPSPEAIAQAAKKAPKGKTVKNVKK